MVAAQQDISDSALLTVVSAPTITTEPADQSVADGDEVTFSVRGDDADTVTWERSTDDGATYVGLDGDNGQDLTFTAELADEGDLYRALLVNGAGTTTSRAALLTVAANAPTVTQDPAVRTVGSPAAVADRQLPATGGNIGLLALAATLLMGTGVTFTASTRRRAII